MSIFKDARFKDVTFGEFIEARDVVINQEIANRQRYLTYDIDIFDYNVLKKTLPKEFYLLPSFEYTIAGADRIDNLAFKFYGDSDFYWCLAEFNRLLDPFDLSAVEKLKIPYKSYLLNLLVALRFE